MEKEKEDVVKTKRELEEKSIGNKIKTEKEEEGRNGEWRSERERGGAHLELVKGKALNIGKIYKKKRVKPRRKKMK